MPRASLVLACFIAAVATSTAQQQPKLRSGVELVSLNVSVTTGSKYVTDLEQKEFEVFEDGVKQSISFFSRRQQPIALALLLDTSNSMEDKLSTAQQAAVGFAKRLKPEDLAEVIEFNSQVQILNAFTNDAAALEKAIRSTDANGSTALYNAIYIGLRELQRVKPAESDQPRRQAIVVLSDGEDTTSLVGYEEVLELAKRAETAVYAIGLRSRDEPSTKGFREAEFVLRSLAQQTGGREFFVDDAKALPEIYQRIADELANQYSIGYMSKNSRRDGAYRRIVVRVDAPDALTRTKQGYYAPGGSR